MLGGMASCKSAYCDGQKYVMHAAIRQREILWTDDCPPWNIKNTNHAFKQRDNDIQWEARGNERLTNVLLGFDISHCYKLLYINMQNLKYIPYITWTFLSTYKYAFENIIDYKDILISIPLINHFERRICTNNQCICNHSNNHIVE